MPRSEAERAIGEKAPGAAARMRGAVKTYGQRRALNGLDLTLEPGRWTGLIGPNGAGKTTSMLAIAGLIPLDEGSVEILGRQTEGAHPEVIGWVPQELALYLQLTALENLETFGALAGVPKADLRERIEWALSWTGLESRAGDRVGAYSGGMQRRLNIACAVLHRPRLLLLDEPTVGVDPQARERIFTMLDQLRQSGVALLHSSHELGDIEDVCDDLVIVDSGRAVAAGPVADLLRARVGDRAVLRLELAGEPAGEPRLTRRADGSFEATLGDAARELPALLETLAASGAEVLALDLRRPGLQDLFLELTGRGLRE
ncbi:MAG: ABC transporter ATP-binding protein [Acidobacteriota bacterium]